MDWSRFELVEEPEVSNAGIDWSAFELVALGPGDGRQATSMANMEPAARAQDGRKVDDPRRTDAPRQASILSDAADQAYGLVKGAAAAVMPWMRPAIEASNGPRPEWKSVLEGPDVVGDARGMDLAEAERLSRRDYAEAVEQRQRIANSPQMRAPTPLNRVQAYAEANPVKAALKQGAASSLAGTLNVPSVAAGLVTEGVNKVLVDGGGSPVFGRVPNMPLVDDLRQMSEGYASTLSRQGPAQAWDNGEFGRWMTVQLAGDSLPAAQALAAMMVPGAQASLSAPMAASAAGSAYAEGDSAMAAALKGGLALASEKLPLTAGQAIRDMVLHIPAPVRAQVLADAGKRLLATGAEITTKGLTGAIQESFNTIGGNAVDIHVSGKDKGLLDDAGRSALVGGVLGTVPSGSKGTRVQAAPLRPGPDSPVGHAQQTPSDSSNPVQDILAGAAGRGGGRADDFLASMVLAQSVTPVAPVVPQAGDSLSLERGTQALPGGHLDASLAPAVPEGDAATIARQAEAEAAGAQQTSATAPDSHGPGPQGGSALDAPIDVSTAAPVGAMHLTDKGTLSVEGDPRQLDKRLRNAGVDQVWMWLDSVWVAPEQAARAQQVLAQPQPGAAADAVRQPPPPVQMTMREGGMLDVEGGTKAVRQWLEDAGVPRGAMTDGPEGVIVTAGSVERAKRALAAPAPVAPALLSTAQTADHEEEAVPVQDGRSATAPPAPMVATKLETGVLKIKGDPKKILAVLRNGGVTNVKVRKKEVTVWANEAALAQEILADNNLAADPAGTETATANNSVKEFDGAGPGAAADDFSNLGLSDLGSKLGEGGTKDVFAYGEKYAVGVLHSGRISELESELKLLGQLKEMGLPVVNARGPIMVGDLPALVYDRFEAGTKDAVRMVRNQPTIGHLSKPRPPHLAPHTNQ
ncbi:hypothetical protein [Acidovorax sp.]|uniref:hypothetical protein n=1 Tax=Acidovorax sp. TaxID=1872122 RepID=UPI002ACEC6AF|nr:hypothetical protein [Acidovorax sp.]MDZ7863182.1 hypothetical protein [Acidovorax sp.]